MITSAPHWYYRRAGLGYLVLPPIPQPWIPPPALLPKNDPLLLARTLRGLRRLNGLPPIPTRRSAPRSRMYGSTRQATMQHPEHPRPATGPHAVAGRG